MVVKLPRLHSLYHFQKVRKDGRCIYEIAVGRIMLPKDVRVLIPKACEYIRFRGERDSVDVINKDQSGRFSSASRWVQCNHMGP